MGSYQSKPSVAEKVLIERLRNAHMETQRESRKEESIVAEKGKPAAAPSRDAQALEVVTAERWSEKLLADPKNRLALTALRSNDIKQVLTSQECKVEDQHVFNVKIPFEGGPVTNQRSSGRCWLFASTNVFRVALMKKYKLDSFELSQNYLFFWDKMEKANWFLEQIISTAHMDLESRLVQHMLQTPLSDGGQWDMVYNIVTKYGLVPQTLYPDSYSAQHSSTLNSIVLHKLREYALVLRSMQSASASALSDAKEHMVEEIATILTLTLGPPPRIGEVFTWNFVDKDGKARSVLTKPKDFARDIYSPDFGVTMNSVAGMVSLVHDPRHEPMTLLSVDRLGNVVGGRGITYVNVGMEELKKACVKMLRAGYPIFFGSDVGKFSTNEGILDLNIIDYNLGFNIGLLGLNKADRLRSGDSQMTHAMVLTAVQFDENTRSTTRWRVQNSWGSAVGDKGWFVMSDSWMDEFVYQAVIDPRFLRAEVKQVLKTEPIVLPLWDPMGSLA